MLIPKRRRSFLLLSVLNSLLLFTFTFIFFYFRYFVPMYRSVCLLLSLYYFVFLPLFPASQPLLTSFLFVILFTVYPVDARDFALLHSVQTTSGAHPASYPVGTKRSFPEGKRQEHEADHSAPFNAQVKNDSAIPPLPHTSS
jgi:hypothetical protein